MSSTPPPNPGTAHPDFAPVAPHVRQQLAEGRPRVEVFLRLRLAITDRLAERVVLNRYRVAGLAPYVGAAFHYVWDVAEDDRARWVAGPARREYETWDGPSLTEVLDALDLRLKPWQEVALEQWAAVGRQQARACTHPDTIRRFRALTGHVTKCLSCGAVLA